MQRMWVVLMFIGYICMSQRIPFGKDQVLRKDLCRGTRTPINMASNMYHLSSTPLKLHKLTTKSLILTSRFLREVSGPGEKESTASRVGIEPFLKHVFFHNWRTRRTRPLWNRSAQSALSKEPNATMAWNLARWAQNVWTTRWRRDECLNRKWYLNH